MDKIDIALFEVKDELLRAMTKFPVGFNSFHEGYAVILEELEELKDEVFKKSTKEARVIQGKAALRAEAVQVAAMSIRFIVDLTDERDI